MTKLREALVLIKTSDPLRYKRMLGDVDKILIGHGPYLGQFIPSLRRCVLDAEHVRAAPSQEIAITIVHEAAHGRLFARGFGYEPEIRERVEAICVQRELAFARKLPDATELLDQLRCRQTLPVETWSNESLQNDENDWLRQRGIPNWLIQLRLKLGRFLSKGKR